MQTVGSKRREPTDIKLTKEKNQKLNIKNEEWQK